MATIVDAINATTETITVSGLDVPVRGTNLSIDDEIVTYAGKTQDPLRPYVQQPENAWRVKRAQAGTTAASHSANATIAVKVKEYGPLPIDANAGGASDAASVTYDPTESGLTAEDVQAAIDEVAAAVPPGEGAQLLVDPGEVWEAETVYSAGDRVFVDDTEIFETEDDGESGAEAPDWYTDMNDVIDNEIGWYWLGQVGDLSRGNLPGGVGGGLGDFALTSPSAIGGSVVVAIAAALAAQGLYTGVDVPSEGAGFAAPAGSLYLAGSGAWYQKYAAGATAWAPIIDNATSSPYIYLNAGRVAFAMPMPTSDPVAAGVLWNDNGTLKVSAGA